MSVPALGMTSFRTVTIVGVGLLGGSLGKALKSRGLARRVVGVGRRQSVIDRAVELGAVDEATLDVREGVADAELTVLATRVGEMPGLVEAMRGHMSRGSLLTDVGSTKRRLVRTLEEMAGDCYRYVGSHPMAGSEKQGVEEASERLFEDAQVFVTRTPQTDERAMALIVGLWQALGAHVRTVSPDDHDHLMAYASHLPHAVAAALVNATPRDAMGCIGQGFLDTSRLASGDPRQWADVCLENRERLVVALGRMGREVQTLRDILAHGGEAELLAWLEGAKAMRDHHAES
ncbi:prephenate dehydrogenase [bacterium]|nr:prephenate dehydrogenase [bacterium]